MFTTDRYCTTESIPQPRILNFMVHLHIILQSISNCIVPPYNHFVRIHRIFSACYTSYHRHHSHMTIPVFGGVQIMKLLTM